MINTVFVMWHQLDGTLIQNLTMPLRWELRLLRSNLSPPIILIWTLPWIWNSEAMSQELLTLRLNQIFYSEMMFSRFQKILSMFRMLSLFAMVLIVSLINSLRSTCHQLQITFLPSSMDKKSHQWICGNWIRSSKTSISIRLMLWF